MQPRAMRGRHLIGAHDLERDAPVELRIVGRVHDAHAAAAELAEHDVAPEHRRLRTDLATGATLRLAPLPVDYRLGRFVVRVPLHLQTSGDSSQDTRVSSSR